MTSTATRDLAWNAFLARRHASRGSRRVVLESSAEHFNVDPDALDALIAAETLARPRLHQWLELAIFIVFAVIRPKRAMRMTLGPAQIRVSYATSESGRALAAAGLDLMTWRSSCERAAAILADAPGNDIDELCRWYNGPRCSKNYMALVQKLIEDARSGSV